LFIVFTICLSIREDWYNAVEQDKSRGVHKCHEDNINAKDNKEFYTPLHNAARDGDLEVIKYCVSKDNDVVNSCSCGYTPLHVAAMYGHLEAVKSLICKGANVHARNAISGDKSIQSATVGGHKNIVGFFLNKEGISINDADNGGRTLPHLAAMYGHLETIKFLVGKGANIHAKSNFNYKPIHHAITNGYKNIVEFFIDIGIGVNDADRDGWTLLHYAADCGQLEIVRFLTDKGANIYAKDNNSLIPSDLARG
jgi:ankyrin repeat protein